MYAVIETGGKQYRVEVGTELEVELLDAEAGQTITLDRVLLVADGDQAAIGRPTVADASVAADVVRQVRGEKVISFKYRPKARRRVTKGHRQELTLLRISDIVLGDRSAAADVRAAEDAARSERQRVEEAARRQAAADAELAAQLAAKAPAKPARTRPARTSDQPPRGAESKGDARTKAAARPSKGAAGTPKATMDQKAAGKRAGKTKGTAKASSDAAATSDAGATPAAGSTESEAPSRRTRKDG